MLLIMFTCLIHILFYFCLVNFNSEERCLSLHCSKEDRFFFPHECSEPLDVVCDDLSKFVLVKSLFYVN